MIEAKGDIWTFPAHAICVTTNGVWKSDGTAVMGAGIAKEAARRFPDAPVLLGIYLRQYGNHVFCIARREDGSKVFSFPTKSRWEEPSKLDLIRQSAKELLARTAPTESVALPRVGTANGGLAWTLVKSILDEELPEDRFIVVTP